MSFNMTGNGTNNVGLNNDSNNPNNKIKNDTPEKCKTCLYTGVAFCTGLSLYFLKEALLDLPDHATTSNMKDTAKREIVRQKRFLLCFSGFWAVGGIYRWYLG